MSWYDAFSNFYDSALEAVYAEDRRTAAQALELGPDSCVLDVPCGTGQSFGALRAAGLVIGVDASAGMAAKARARAERDQQNVRVLHADASAVEPAALAGARIPH